MGYSTDAGRGAEWGTLNLDEELQARQIGRSLGNLANPADLQEGAHWRGDLRKEQFALNKVRYRGAPIGQQAKASGAQVLDAPLDWVCPGAARLGRREQHAAELAPKLMSAMRSPVALHMPSSA